MADFRENVALPASGVAPDLQSLVPINPQLIAAAVAQLDEIIGHAMSQTGVPGLAAAVVHDGELLYVKGFGVRDISTGAPVDPEGATVFQLASVSKPLSATVVARAVGRGVVEWTDLVLGHLPSFALADPYVTEHLTLADLFCHRSGLPDHAGDLLEDLGYDQDRILDRLRLEPLAPFRANWHYTNLGLTAAAVAAAAAARQPWADLADDMLFGPVGMLASSFRYSDFRKRDDRAAMHVREGTQWVQKYTRDADPEAPAGGASSNVRDLAKWLMLQLAGGAWKGEPLIDAGALGQTWLPWARSGMPSTPSARSSFYGLGTGVSYDYAGRLRISHSGGFSQGAATAFTLLPSASLGIVVLTNAMPIGVPEAVVNYFLDHVYAGRQQQSWLTLYGERFAEMYVNHSELAGKKPPANPVPPHPDPFYTGTYGNPYYGPIQITADRGSLHLLIGRGPNDYPLQHWSEDLFAFFPTGENALGITAATFNAGPGGTLAQSVTLEYYNATGLGTFGRT
jgi:CubicO group peptidase (beta-lactamase class C family)